MNFFKKSFFGFLIGAAVYALTLYVVNSIVGSDGLWGPAFSTYTFWKLIIYAALMTHLTITCMSISFHRYHTHQGVILNKVTDTIMQTWLWLITSMGKLDWVSVHRYHHLHSDQDKDPHSPVKKGLAHVFFLGAWDYNTAKQSEDVLKIRNRLSTTPYELFISRNTFLGPAIAMVVLLFLLGPFWGSILAIINFLISPIFAVGGVNALAHHCGYKNHKTNDNSRNIGFLVPLNFLICGELDHNNHHAHQRSCSFRHKWYEFDIGYLYIRILSFFKLADIRTVYNPSKFKKDLALKALALIEVDYQFRQRFQILADQLNKNMQDLQNDFALYFEGKKNQLEEPARQFAVEIKIYLRQQTSCTT